MEEKANRALDEALALAELRAGAKEDDLDDLIAELEKNMEKDGALQWRLPLPRMNWKQSKTS